MRVLGLAARSHDSGIALLNDGHVDLVYEEERFNREKHTRAYPVQSLDYMFANGIAVGDLDAIAMPWNINELRRTVRGLWMRNFPRSLSILGPDNHGPISYWIVAMRAFVWQDMKRRARGGRVPKFVEVNHHDAHAAAFFVSPYDDADVLVIDGYGDQGSTSVYVGAGNRIEQLWRNEQLHSLGVLYSLTTRFLGFPVFGDEGKVMGLSAYGSSALVDKFFRLVHLHSDGTYTLNMDYFSFDIYGEKSPFKRKFFETFGAPYTDCSSPTQHQLDIAFALQAVIERAILHVVRGVQKKSGRKRLVFAGGVAMNCVANAKILEETDYDEIWVPPGASDAGVPLGAALYHTHQTCGVARSFELTHAFYGTSYDDEEIVRALTDAGLTWRKLERFELISKTAQTIADGKIVGWFQGRYEMGPRALGNRSILADPRRADMKDTINARIKHREGFRPFAPAVLADSASEWFHIDQADPFMTIAPRIRDDKKSLIPAVVHADGTGRFQTVNRSANDRYHDLILAFGQLTGVPILLNTSFNKQEPVVTRPEEAISCYLRTDMDALVLGDYFVDDRSEGAIQLAKARFKR